MADLKYLRRLSRDYPNIKAASAEIINLKAILALPKGTEYFLSDLHGEHEAFIHMIKSASGTIKMKIDEHFEVLGEKEREDLASLIYNAEAEIERRKRQKKILTSGVLQQFTGLSSSANQSLQNIPGQR